MAQFRMHGAALLAVDLTGETVRARNGSMVAYEGRMQFRRQGVTGGEGLMGAVRRRMAGEQVTLMEITGEGTVYLAHEAAHLTLIPLAGDALLVESRSLLAVDGGLRTGVRFTGLRGLSTGQGLATTTVEGHGTVAILSDGPAIGLEVAPGQPLSVDPQAYVAHRGPLQQEFVSDVNWRTALGHGSGESFQLRFSGQGLVYIQPAERPGGLAEL